MGAVAQLEERCNGIAKVRSSTLRSSTKYAPLAQRNERLAYTQDVGSSNLSRSTTQEVSMKFEVTDEQKEKISKWAGEQDAVWLQKQKSSDNSFARRLAADNIPYYGAIGGELTYCFSPTSLGDILVVKHGGTGAELNVTDFDNW